MFYGFPNYLDVRYFYNSPVLGTRSAMALRAAILLAGEMLLLVDSRMVGDVVCSR